MTVVSCHTSGRPARNNFRVARDLGTITEDISERPTVRAISEMFRRLNQNSTLSQGAVTHGVAARSRHSRSLCIARVPARIVWGTGDTVFSPASPDWLDHTFPRSRAVRRVEGAKAFFPEEMPDIIAEEAGGCGGSHSDPRRVPSVVKHQAPSLELAAI